MCDCIDKVNKELEPRNTALTIPLFVILATGEQQVGDRIMLAVEKIDPKKRGRVTSLFAAYCPVCGEKYPDQQRSAQIVETLPDEAASQ